MKRRLACIVATLAAEASIGVAVLYLGLAPMAADPASGASWPSRPPAEPIGLGRVFPG